MGSERDFVVQIAGWCVPPARLARLLPILALRARAIALALVAVPVAVEQRQ
ncbi:hypothetical protein ASAP_1562 [Asaia bogorensis]|uniref:Uncharacterized protein n=1 Tax=Asaia bogorensis TaxID=91915 RepID=A0A060QKP1_9PROT|nr:hypothetical protein ASAP_1562 [Asaia bogorensis]